MDNEQEVDWEKYAEARLLGRNRLVLPHHRETIFDFVEFFSIQPCELEILDIGCAAGFFLVLLRELGFQKISGFDISHDFVEQARSKGLNCDVADVLDEKKKTITQKYDVVLLMDLLEHLTNPAKALEIVRRRVLRQSGILFITIPTYDSLAEKYARMILKKTKLQQAREHDPTHVQAFSQRGFHNILDETGFNIMESKRLYCQIPRISNSRLGLVLEHILPECIKGKFLRVAATPKKGS